MFQKKKKNPVSSTESEYNNWKVYVRMGGGGVPAGHIGCRRAGQQKGVLIFFHTIWELNCRVWAAHAAYIWSGHSGLWPCAHHQVLFSCLAKYKSLVLLYYTGLVFNMEKTRRFFWGQGWVMLSVLQMYFSVPVWRK